MPREFSSEADNTKQNPSLILSFVVRIWLDVVVPGRPPTWRGQITVVKQEAGTSYTEAPRLAFDDLDRMTVFMLGQMERAGVRVPWHWRVRRFIYNQLQTRITGRL